MRDNILFRNIAEVQGEDNKKVIQMLYKFFDVELKIPSGELEKIEIIRAHRIGNKGKYTRAIVAKVNEAGKDLIWKHTKNLKGTNFSVMNQLPRELAERRRQLVPEYKQAKQNRHNVKWIGEKLLLEGKIKEVRRDVIKDINTDVIQIAADMKVKRAPPSSFQGSSFQGSSVKLSNTDHVVPALHAIYGDTRVARATHNIYAYRIVSGDRTIEHYEDDGEHGAGRRLLDLLRDKDVNDRIICVTRWYGFSSRTSKIQSYHRSWQTCPGSVNYALSFGYMVNELYLSST
jgi:hypothetical protein